MNTDEEYKDYCAAIIQAEKIDYPNPTAVATRAVKTGLADFWGAGNWYFAQDELEFSIADGEESYSLPTNFAGFITMREETSAWGARLQFYPKEEFDLRVPKMSAYNNNTPQMFTIYHDAGENKAMKLKLFPIPSSSQTIYIRFKTRPPSNVGAVPDEFQSGVEAFIAKHLYPFGHRGYQAAYKLALVELNRLRAIDKTDHSNVTRFQDSTQRQTYIGGDEFYWDGI